MTVAVLPRVLRLAMTAERIEEQRLLVEITEAMKQTTYLPLRQIELRYDAGTVVLRGLVPTFFLKQVAQVTVMSVQGVRQIDNQLRVSDVEQRRLESSAEPLLSMCVRETTWPRSRVLLVYA